MLREPSMNNRERRTVNCGGPPLNFQLAKTVFSLPPVRHEEDF